MATRKTPAGKVTKTPVSQKPKATRSQAAAPAKPAGGRWSVKPAEPSKGGDQANDRALVAEAVQPGRRAAHGLVALAERLKASGKKLAGGPRTGAGADVAPALEALAQAYLRLLDAPRR